MNILTKDQLKNLVGGYAPNPGSGGIDVVPLSLENPPGDAVWPEPPDDSDATTPAPLPKEIGFPLYRGGNL